VKRLRASCQELGGSAWVAGPRAAGALTIGRRASGARLLIGEHLAITPRSTGRRDVPSRGGPGAWSIDHDV